MMMIIMILMRQVVFSFKKLKHTFSIPGQPMMEPNPHSNWKIPWKKRSGMFAGKR